MEHQQLSSLLKLMKIASLNKISSSLFWLALLSTRGKTHLHHVHYTLCFFFLMIKQAFYDLDKKKTKLKLSHHQMHHEHNSFGEDAALLFMEVNCSPVRAVHICLLVGFSILGSSQWCLPGGGQNRSTCVFMRHQHKLSKLGTERHDQQPRGNLGIRECKYIFF